MRKSIKRALVTVTPALVLATSGALADGYGDRDEERFKARLSGFQENPVVFTKARGRFRAKLEGDSLKYTLSYRGITTPVLFTHIHLGRRGVNGGVMAFLCDNAGNDPTGRSPRCPGGGGTVTGRLAAADILEPTLNGTTQGLSAEDFSGFIRTLKQRAGYVNLHTEEFRSGELRGNIRRDD